MEKKNSVPNIRLFLLSALVAFLSTAAGSEPSAPHSELIDNLRLGGYVIVFRHGATTSDQANSDPMSNPMNRKSVAAERQLNEQGRAQAKSIGDQMRKLNIPVGLVLTSTTHRAVDTGTLLGFGEVTANPDLAEGTSAEESNRRAQVLRRLVATPPPPDNNTVIVSHKPNIVDAFGKELSDVREGEASVFEPDGHGCYKLIVRVQADEWSKLPQTSK
jgi:broad specificity phosphatase PhoE